MTKKETFKWIVQIIASVASAILTALSATSCAGYGPIALWSKRWNSQQKNDFCGSYGKVCHFCRIFRFLQSGLDERHLAADLLENDNILVHGPLLSLQSHPVATTLGRFRLNFWKWPKPTVPLHRQNRE